MASRDFKQKSVDVHSFAMIPSSDVPRARFDMDTNYKTTFDASNLVPFFCEEMLPGDHFNISATLFARLVTPVAPTMDNLHLESFFFFVPNRLVWDKWQRFMGERANPTDSIDFTIPTSQPASGAGYSVGSLQDYFGLPVTASVAGTGPTAASNPALLAHSALPLRAYNLIWNEWFRDQNLQNSVTVPTGDGPDLASVFTMLKRGKRKDYFTSCLPWPQKGDPVSLALTGNATVIPTPGATDAQLRPMFQPIGAVAGAYNFQTSGGAGPTGTVITEPTSSAGDLRWATGASTQTGLVADLSSVTAATINDIRLAFQTQKLLERDARGGTRYTEIVRSHFRVVSPDARLQRPEYIGGGRQPITVSSVPQTSGTGITGQATPAGNLSAWGTTLGSHRASYAATEHGYVIGLMNVYADLSYPAQLRKHWTRSTRYDFYFPAFAMLGEQAVLTGELVKTGTSADDTVFGYQERWAEYRYIPSMLTGLQRPQVASNLGFWNYAEVLNAPVLNANFVVDNAIAQVPRTVAVANPVNQQFVADIFIKNRATRPLPLFSVPGLVDHF